MFPPYSTSQKWPLEPEVQTFCVLVYINKLLLTEHTHISFVLFLSSFDFSSFLSCFYKK